MSSTYAPCCGRCRGSRDRRPAGRQERRRRDDTLGGPRASVTAAQVLAGVQKNMTSAKQVNTKPHINTMTRAMNVNVYQVASGVYAYTSSLAVDDDGSDPNPDPDHQNQTTFKTSDGKYLGASPRAVLRAG